MNKLLTYVLAAMAFVACTQNDVEELTVNRADVPETLTVGFEGGDTRIELNNALKTVWTEGDEVSVYFYSDANQKWQYQGETGERLGMLRRVDASVATTQTDYVVVAYPYNTSYTLNRINANLIASLPAVQSYKEGSYGSEGNIMVAQSEFTQFSLKSVCGWLRVELTGEGEVVESVKVRGNNGEQVAGLIYVDTATAEATLASEMGEASDEEEVGGVGGGLEFDDTVFTEVTLDCGDGVTLGAEATAFYIALLPQTFEKGVTIEVDYANAEPQTLICESSITIHRNHIAPVNSEAESEAIVSTNQLWYTATALVEPNSSAFNVAITSNKWNETTGEGIITFDGELTEIGWDAFYYCESLTSITIPDSVTTIGYGAFRSCHSLTSVTIPDSVTTIGEIAFYWCSSLTSVTIPDSVTTIGKAAFGGCDSLTSVTIPDSVTTIGDVAFGECHNLTSVTIPDSITTIGEYAFGRCYSLTSVTIPDSVTTIGDDAFYYCSSLTSVTIPDSVTTIGNYAFSWCESLTSVTIPDSVTTIGDYAFRSCGSLTSVTIPDSVTTIGGGVFGGCIKLAEFKGKFAADGGRCLIKDNTLIAYANASGTTYTIPDSVTTIGDYAFRSCGSLTSVTIPNSVTTIGDEAFYYCESLTSVTIGDSVTTIGDEAFAYCNSLTSVTIGNSVTTIGASAFRYCSSLAEFKGKFAADGGRCLIIDGVLNAFVLGCGVTEYTIPDSVTTIGNSAFNSCESLTSVTIPDSVTTIGNSAFSYCRSLTSVTIPDSVTTIGEDAFRYCDSLTSVTIPDSVTTIGDGAFSNCNSLTSVTIPDSVTTIGGSAFAFCESLTSVTIPDSVTTIGDEAFYECDSLKSVYCKATTPPSLGYDAFKYYDYGYFNIGPIYVPAESVEAYKAATNWSEYAAGIVGYDFETGEVVE